MPSPRSYRAGESIEDYCRACKTDRMHTVVVVDGDGVPIRVDCGFCHSEHNYRGGPRVGHSAAPQDSPGRDRDPGHGSPQSSHRGPTPFPIVSERERIAPSMKASDGTSGDLEMLLRQIIREEIGLT